MLSLAFSVLSLSLPVKTGPVLDLAGTLSKNNSIVDLAVATPDLSTLVAALKAADLVDTLSGTGPFTVFAPTNEAFAKLPKSTLDALLKPENKASLVDVLTYHVVSGDIRVKDLAPFQNVPTVEGKDVGVIKREHDKSVRVFVNNAEVTTADVGASNGVVHIIDSVLIPPGFKPPSASSYAYATAANEIMMATFDGADKALTHSWRAENDPVMGGQSFSTVKVENNVLNFTGKVVKGVSATAFVTAVTSDKKVWPDVSSCEGIEVTAKAASDYKGYLLSFGDRLTPGGGGPTFGGYKLHFTPTVGSFGAAKLPFNEFTDSWDNGTGRPIKTCAEDKRHCPDEKTLKDVKIISIWAEAVEGTVDIQVKSISAYGCK